MHGNKKRLKSETFYSDALARAEKQETFNSDAVAGAMMQATSCFFLSDTL